MNKTKMQKHVSSHFAKLPANEPWLCVMAPRKSGKTTFLCELAVKLARGGKRVTIIVSSKGVRREVLEIINKLLENLEYSGTIAVKSCRECAVLDNTDVILVDEAGYIDPLFFFDNIASLMISKPYTTLLMIGTPKGKTNFFSKLCRAGGPINHVINAMGPMAKL